MYKTLLSLLFIITLAVLNTSCVPYSYQDMTEAEIKYKDCLKRAKKNKEFCNNLKYDYQMKAEDYAKDAEDFWYIMDLETEEEKIIEQYREFK